MPNTLRGGPRRRTVRGFTIVELLVVIGIIAVLISILLPVVSRMREQARRVADMSNLRQLCGAVIDMAKDNRGTFPNPTAPSSTSVDWFSGDMWYTMWKKYGISANCGTCPNLRDLYGQDPTGPTPWIDKSGWVEWKESIDPRGGGMMLGYQCWAGRIDLLDASNKLAYMMPKTLGGKAGPVDASGTIISGDTLWTCEMLVAMPSTFRSVVPHKQGGGAALYSNGGYPVPPEGLCIGLIDGSARWVPFSQLKQIKNNNKGTTWGHAKAPWISYYMQ
jgi:prepilin-type N-terminal cleavage/methylation domain-containing protein